MSKNVGRTRADDEWPICLATHRTRIYLLRKFEADCEYNNKTCVIDGTDATMSWSG